MVKPYEGRKYQADQWAPLMFATETAVYDTILMTKHRLKNPAVQQAFTELARQLRRGVSATLTSEDVQPVLTIGDESAFIIWMIRANWTNFFVKNPRVATADLIGILRTLLNSIEAHEWNTGRDRGYVDFLPKFMERNGMGRNIAFLDEEPDEDGWRAFNEKGG